MQTSGQGDGGLTTRSGRRAARTLAVTLGACAVMMTVVTGTASAAGDPGHALCNRDPQNPDKCGGTPQTYPILAVAKYIDETNRACIEDTWTDGHSALAVVWPAGQYEKRQQVWAHSGSGDSACTEVHPPFENADYAYKACIGEWSFWPAQRKVLSCGPTKTFDA
jgi:hypothetical protein